MEDLYGWSVRDPKWARLSTILSAGQVRLDAHSNGAFDEFVKSRPAEERQDWLDLFASYSAGQRPAARGQTFVIAKDRPDPLGRIVRRIHVDTDEFVIYCADHADDPDDPCSLAYCFKDGAVTNEQAKAMRAGLCPIAAQVARLADVVVGMRPMFGDNARHRRERERAFDLMARAIAFGFEGRKDEAKGILADLEAEMTLRRDSRNRMRYIAATTLSFLAIVAAGVALKEMQAAWLGARAIGSEVQTLVVDVLLFGALGAFFSVVYDIKAVKVHHAISFPEMIYAGAIRIPVGVIAATVAILLITGDWVLSGLGAEPKSWSVLLLGFLAGFSEMFVPNALKDMQKRSTVGGPGGAAAGAVA